MAQQLIAWSTRTNVSFAPSPGLLLILVLYVVLLVNHPVAAIIVGIVVLFIAGFIKWVLELD